MPFIRITRTLVNASSSSLLIGGLTSSRHVKRCRSMGTPFWLSRSGAMRTSWYVGSHAASPFAGRQETRHPRVRFFCDAPNCGIKRRQRSRRALRSRSTLERRAKELALQHLDVLRGDVLRAHRFALAFVRARAKAFGLHLLDHAHHAARTFRLSLGKIG